MNRLPLPSGLGALLTTEQDHAELGEFQGKRLRARVQRRTLRIALGNRRGFRLDLTRMRPAAIEVFEGASMYELPIAAPSHPWALGRRRLALFWVATQLAITLRARVARALLASSAAEARGQE